MIGRPALEVSKLQLPAKIIQRHASNQSKAERFTLTAESAPTFPRHFLATGVHCGVKKNPKSLDLGLIVSSSPYPTSSAACFTKNAFQAAPVQVCKAVLSESPTARALVVNSGCANAVTGSKGLADAWSMAQAVNDLFGSNSAASKSLPKMSTLVMSTGVIGQKLPMQRILPSLRSSCLPTLSSSFESWDAAARAFMTTDTFPKLRTKECKISGREDPIRFVGIDKGAGMIHPNMAPHATMLGMIATDATIGPAALQSALAYAVDRSFNSISVDGDMSTNDTVVALANGAAWEGYDEIVEGEEGWAEFRDTLTEFATELAGLVVWDGEGATKFVSISVEECPSYAIAHKIASTISTSTILKCAINGEDANWGRILCAIGYSDAADFTIDPTKVSVSFVDQTAGASNGKELRLLVDGEPVDSIDEEYGSKVLAQDHVHIKVKMGQGKEAASYYTCDLSKEYVAINGDYRS